MRPIISAGAGFAIGLFGQLMGAPWGPAISNRLTIVVLDPATETALTSLFFATFTGACLGGMVGATLERRERVDAAKNRHSG